MNILIAINKGYIRPAMTMLRSLAETNESQINVYILHYELEDGDIKKIEKSVADFSVKIFAIKIEKKVFEHYTIPKQFSMEIFIRLIAYKILPTDINKILWLDSDMIILNDISDLYNKTFEGKMMLVCRDIGCNEKGIMEKRQKRLDNPNMEEYFNSGMLLMNLEKMREKFHLEEVFEVLNKQAEELIYPDQDILNKILWNDVTYVDADKYNKQVFSYEDYNIEQLKNDTKILHYVGKIKPWNFRYEGIAKTLYFDILKKIDINFYFFIVIKKSVFKIKWKLKKGK